MFIVHASLINRSITTSTSVVASRKRASDVSSANLFLALDFSLFITEKVLSQTWASAEKNAGGGQKHSQDGHLSESYSQISVSDRVTN